MNAIVDRHSSDVPSTEKLQIVLEKLLYPSRSLWRRASQDRVSQHNTRPARPRPRPIFWTETGLVLRPTVSDHITDLHAMSLTHLSHWHIKRSVRLKKNFSFRRVSWFYSTKSMAWKQVEQNSKHAVIYVL